MKPNVTLIQILKQNKIYGIHVNWNLIPKPLAMDSSKILHADVLDIIFEGRNKEYGAYELRKTYNGRLNKALIGTAAVVIILLMGYYFANKQGKGNKHVDVVSEFTLEDYKEKKPEPLPQIKIEKPQVRTVALTPPRIVREEVKENERPPDVDQIEDAKISNMMNDGNKDDGIVAPAANDGKGVIEAPKDNTDYDQTFVSVQIESEYPGGIAAWMRYLTKSLHYPDAAQSAEVQGDVLVQFIVDKEGNVSYVQAVSGPDELREEAVRVIRKSGRWTPAIQNGRTVKSYKKQPVKFRLQTE